MGTRITALVSSYRRINIKHCANAEQGTEPCLAAGRDEWSVARDDDSSTEVGYINLLKKHEPIARQLLPYIPHP